MAHKHNRRRIRPRTRNHAPSSTSSSIDGMLSVPGLTEIAPPVCPRTTQVSNKRAIVPQYNCLTDLSVQQWRHRYMSWQTRERQQQRVQQEAAAKLEADQCRLFGGEPGDDIHEPDNDAYGYDNDLMETTKVRNEGRGGYNALPSWYREMNVIRESGRGEPMTFGTQIGGMGQPSYDLKQ